MTIIFKIIILMNIKVVIIPILYILRHKDVIRVFIGSVLANEGRAAKRAEGEFWQLDRVCQNRPNKHENYVRVSLDIFIVRGRRCYELHISY